MSTLFRICCFRTWKFSSAFASVRVAFDWRWCWIECFDHRISISKLAGPDIGFAPYCLTLLIAIVVVWIRSDQLFEGYGENANAETSSFLPTGFCIWKQHHHQHHLQQQNHFIIIAGCHIIVILVILGSTSWESGPMVAAPGFAESCKKLEAKRPDNSKNLTLSYYLEKEE